MRFVARLLGFLLLPIALMATAADRAEIAPADLSSEPVFYGAPIEPPKGRVYHGWGQFSGAWNEGKPPGAGDANDLEAYEQAVKPYRPVMLSFYAAPDRKILPVFLDRYKKLVAQRGCFVAEIGFYFQSIQDPVVNGERDPEIVLLADTLHEARNPVLLRIGYEFNNPWKPYDSSKYIKAFRSIVGRLREVHASNIATVWNATPTGFKGANYMKWYPGDDVVDWWSVNIFQIEDFSRPELAAFLNAAREHHKPVLIGEASPVMTSRTPAHVRGPASEAEAVEWYSKLAELIRRRPEIQAVSLISLDWRRMKSELPTWEFAGFGWPDARITRWPKALALWKNALSDHRFIGADECSSIRGR